MYNNDYYYYAHFTEYASIEQFFHPIATISLHFSFLSYRLLPHIHTPIPSSRLHPFTIPPHTSSLTPSHSSKSLSPHLLLSLVVLR